LRYKRWESSLTHRRKELIDDAVAAVITFPIMALFNLERAAEAKKRLAAPWSSRDGAA